MWFQLARETEVNNHTKPITEVDNEQLVIVPDSHHTMLSNHLPWSCISRVQFLVIDYQSNISHGIGEYAFDRCSELEIVSVLKASSITPMSFQ